MQKITSCLWFDNQAEEAVNFYTSLFPNAKIGATAHYDAESAKVSGQPEGSILTIEFELAGQHFTALNGGPLFKFTPSISFFVSCGTEQEIDELWKALIAGGTALMELTKYPFSEKFGWVQDKYGVSWQLNLASRPQKITPFLMFVGPDAQAEEAVNFYTSIFDNAKVISLEKFAPGEPGKEGSAKHAIFTLEGQEFMAMDGGAMHKFNFSLATSFIVNCENQDEVDKFWKALSADPAFEQCGWLKDKYGVSWQVVPTILVKLLADPDPVKAQRVMRAMLQMKKLDIAALQQAYEG